jgi:hypothetical protein
MKIYGPPVNTYAETIRQYGELATRGRDPEVAAKEWTDAGFDDEMTARWLAVRCFDAQAARALADMSIKPEQAAVRTRDGGDYKDTIGFKVANGDLTPRQAAARCLSSR